MFARPRIKKSILPLPNKKRKAVSAVEEVNFDKDAREEYLTGFHKRKLQRIKHAQEEAAKKARLEKIETRKQMKEERKREVEEHVQTVTALLRKAQAAGAEDDQEIEPGDFEEWDGIEEKPQSGLVDYEEEYVDEDRFTTVKVEAISISRDGLEKIQQESSDEDEPEEEVEGPSGDKTAVKAQKEWPKKKKKFRYEDKFERRSTERKQRAKKRAKFKE